MQNKQHSIENDQWVIWNSSLGIADMVSIGDIEASANGQLAWLEEPYEMVGPFDLDELISQGKIHFAACMVMSRQKWQKEQLILRRESQSLRQEMLDRIFAQHARFNQNRQPVSHFDQYKEKQYRSTLNLPKQGELKPAEIKAAYRKLAQKAHPDAGGSDEQFILISKAKEALLKLAS